MAHLETRYYRLNKLLLLPIGLWPDQQSKFSRFQRILFSIILSTSVILQATPVIKLKFSMDFITKSLSSVLFFAMPLIKYNAFFLKFKVVKIILVELQYKLDKLKDENEIAIISKYSCIANRYTIALSLFAVVTLFIGFIIQVWFNLINVDPSINVSQIRLPIKMEYFVDQEKYFSLYMLHTYVFLCIGGFTLVATGTILITYLQYICGMFSVASYRIDRAMNINVLKNITSKNKILMTKSIICAVKIHRQAIKMSKQLMTIFEIMMFGLIICGVVSVSINLFQIASKTNIKELFFPFVFVNITVLYMFISNYIGQNIIDHNKHVFSTVYNVQWYRAPLHVQKMILFLLQKETKEVTLNVGGLFNASIECFATLFKASISYFTVIYSTRQ
ncbi:odorant receptor 13a-like [Cardiocondyla obscurior]|uniref:odorant receptor 13a-like n=1 Tax=Cardiocondyla obscurior TaxID=286306 RepID=UPI00396584DD